MTDQDRITAIIAAIQQDSNLILVLRAAVTKNIVNVSSEQLIAICQLLGI